MPEEHRPSCGNTGNAEDYLFDACEQQTVCEGIGQPSPWGHGIPLRWEISALFSSGKKRVEPSQFE
jgi:hypothetical protein